MVKRTLPFILLLSAVTLMHAAPQPFQFLCGVLQALFLPGFVFTLFVLNGRISRDDRIVLSILLSPILLAILVIVPRALGADDIYLSARLVLALCYLLLVVALVQGRHMRGGAPGSIVPRQVFIVSLAYGGLILVSYIVNGYLLVRSDSWYHAAVIQEVVNRGIPPGEPLLADYPILYMWFYHLYQAVVMRLTGLALFNTMALFNIVNAMIFPYVIARFTSYFTGRRGVIVFATILALAGLDAVSWVLWPLNLLRAFVGEVTGAAELERILSAVEINGVSVIYFLAPAGAWNINFSDKFLTITIFNYSLNLFLVTAVIALRNRFLESGRVRSAILLFVIILGVFLFHVVTGIVLLLVFSGYGVLMFLASRFVYDDVRKPKDLLLPFFVVLLVGLIAVPYFLTFVSGGGKEEGGLMGHLFHFGLANVLTILYPLVILFVPSRDAFRKLLSSRSHTSRTMIMWIICLLILNIFINIGTVGEKKLIYYLFLIIGPPIFVQVIERIEASSGTRRVLLISAVAILFIVPPVLTFRGFMMEAPKTEMGIRRYSPTDEDMRFFEWVSNNTSEDAVIAENNIYHLSPVYAGRRNLYSWYYVVTALDYAGEELDLYRDVQASIFGEEGISGDTIDGIRAIGKELYIAVWQEDITSNPWLADRFDADSEWFKKVYSSNRVSLYTLK